MQTNVMNQELRQIACELTEVAAKLAFVVSKLTKLAKAEASNGN